MGKYRDQLAVAVDKIRKVASLFKRRGHGTDVRIGVGLLGEVERKLEKGAVLSVIEVREDDRAGDGEAIVILPINRRGGVEEAARIEELIAVDVKGVAVEGVGAGGGLVSHSSLG